MGMCDLIFVVPKARSRVAGGTSMEKMKIKQEREIEKRG